MRGTPAIVLMVALEAALAPAVFSDVIRLKNGNVVEGTVESRTENEITVQIPGVGVMVFATSDVAAIEAGPGAAPVTAPAEATAASPEPAADEVPADARWAIFRSPERTVRMAYPKGWRVQELKDSYPYLVSFRPAPGADGTEPPVAIELFKYYHPSYALGLKARGTPEEFMQAFLAQFSQMGGRILGEEPLDVQGAAGRVFEAEGTDKSGVHRLFVLSVAKHDVVVQLYCQAPPAEFESYRALFKDVIAQAQPFSADPKRKDGEWLDQHTGRLEMEAVKAFEAGDGETFAKRFQEAKRINPGNAQHPLQYGTRLFMLAAHRNDAPAQEVLERAEHELRLALALADCWAPPEEAAPIKGQAFYMLAGMADRVGRSDDAKAMLRESLRVYPSPKVEALLKRMESGAPPAGPER